MLQLFFYLTLLQMLVIWEPTCSFVRSLACSVSQSTGATGCFAQSYWPRGKNRRQVPGCPRPCLNLPMVKKGCWTRSPVGGVRHGLGQPGRGSGALSEEAGELQMPITVHPFPTPSRSCSLTGGGGLSMGFVKKIHAVGRVYVGLPLQRRHHLPR